jgi:hypothetical protein
MIITIDNLKYTVKEIDFITECDICFSKAHHKLNDIFICKKCLKNNLSEVEQNILKLNWKIIQIIEGLNKYIFEKILDYDYELCAFCKNKALFDCNFNYIYMKLCENCFKKRLVIILDKIM